MKQLLVFPAGLCDGAAHNAPALCLSAAAKKLAGAWHHGIRERPARNERLRTEASSASARRGEPSSARRRRNDEKIYNMRGIKARNHVSAACLKRAKRLAILRFGTIIGNHGIDLPHEVSAAAIISAHPTRSAVTSKPAEIVTPSPFILKAKFYIENRGASAACAHGRAATVVASLSRRSRASSAQRIEIVTTGRRRSAREECAIAVAFISSIGA